MKVKELVEQLHRMNPELEVRYWYEGEDNQIKNASCIVDAFQINFSKKPEINAVILTVK